MKKLKTILARSLSTVAPLALALAIFTANSTCWWFTYQPDEPAALQRYKFGKRSDASIWE